MATQMLHDGLANNYGVPRPRTCNLGPLGPGPLVPATHWNIHARRQPLAPSDLKQIYQQAVTTFRVSARGDNSHLPQVVSARGNEC